jgi:hypothetical protein
MTAFVSEAVRQLLLNDVDVFAVTGQRISTDYDEQGDDEPRIVIQHLPGGFHHHHFTGSAGLVESRLQIDFLAASKPAALDLSEKARLALDSFTGDVTVGLDTFTFQRLFIDDDFGDSVREDGGNDTDIARVSQDYMAGYAEAIPSH